MNEGHYSSIKETFSNHKKEILDLQNAHKEKYIYYEIMEKLNKTENLLIYNILEIESNFYSIIFNCPFDSKTLVSSGLYKISNLENGSLVTILGESDDGNNVIAMYSLCIQKNNKDKITLDEGLSILVKTIKAINERNM